MNVFCLKTDLISRGIKPYLRYMQILFAMMIPYLEIVYHCLSIPEFLNSAMRLVVSGYSTIRPIISSEMAAGM